MGALPVITSTFLQWILKAYECGPTQQHQRTLGGQCQAVQRRVQAAEKLSEESAQLPECELDSSGGEVDI